MFVTNWISTTKIQKISEITNFFRHYFLSRTEVYNERKCQSMLHFTNCGQRHSNQCHHLHIKMARSSNQSLLLSLDKALIAINSHI